VGGKEREKQQAIEDEVVHDPVGIRGPDEALGFAPFDQKKQVLLE
jgi:hypothetical protein